MPTGCGTLCARSGAVHIIRASLVRVHHTGLRLFPAYRWTQGAGIFIALVVSVRMALSMGNGMTGTVGVRGLWRNLRSVFDHVAVPIGAGEDASYWRFTVSRDVLWTGYQSIGRGFPGWVV